MTSRRIPTALLCFISMMLLTAGLTFVLTTPAQAHSELASSTPEDGSELYEQPAELVLEFNEDIQDIGNEIAITGPSGEAMVDGDPQVDGSTVTQAVAAASDPEAAIGDYTVTWRVVSADGHPISGELTFEVLRGTMGDTVSEEPTTEDVTTEAAETTGTAAPSSSESATEEGDSTAGMGAAGPMVIALAAVVLVGVVTLVVRRRRAR